MKKTAGKIKPQTTIVSVAVTTAGPVSMKAVREWVEDAVRDKMDFGKSHVSNEAITRITVRRDANMKRP